MSRILKETPKKRHIVSPEEEIPEWILAKVEEEDGEGEEGSKKERSARMWAMSKGRFSSFLGCFDFMVIMFLKPKHQLGIGGKNIPGYFTAAWINISSTYTE